MQKVNSFIFLLWIFFFTMKVFLCLFNGCLIIALKGACFFLLSRFLLLCAVIKFDCYINCNMELWDLNCVFQQCTYFISYMPCKFFVFKSFNSCCHVSLSPAHISYQTCGVPAHAPGMTNLGWNSLANSNERANKFEMWLHCNYLCPDLEICCFLLLLQGMAYLIFLFILSFHL